MKSSKFKPLSAPVYQPMALTPKQISTGRAASEFLKAHNCSPINGEPIEPATRARRPRLARVCKDTSKLTLDI